MEQKTTKGKSMKTRNITAKDFEVGMKFAGNDYIVTAVEKKGNRVLVTSYHEDHEYVYGTPERVSDYHQFQGPITVIDDTEEVEQISKANFDLMVKFG